MLKKTRKKYLRYDLQIMNSDTFTQSEFPEFQTLTGTVKCMLMSEFSLSKFWNLSLSSAEEKCMNNSFSSIRDIKFCRLSWFTIHLWL